MFGEKIHRSAFLRQVPIYHSVYLGHYYGYTIWHVYQNHEVAYGYFVYENRIFYNQMVQITYS